MADNYTWLYLPTSTYLLYINMILGYSGEQDALFCMPAYALIYLLLFLFWNGCVTFCTFWSVLYTVYSPSPHVY